MSKKTRQQHKIESLRNLVNDSKFLQLLPIVHNQNIQISSYTVSDTIDGFVVKDTKTQKELSITTTKHAAIALVKDMLRNGNLSREIHVLDYVISKNKIDEIFYKQTLKASKDPTVKFVAKTRLQIARQDTHQARQELYDIIFNF